MTLAAAVAAASSAETAVVDCDHLVAAAAEVDYCYTVPSYYYGEPAAYDVAVAAAVDDNNSDYTDAGADAYYSGCDAVVQGGELES